MESILIIYVTLTVFAYVSVVWLVFSHFREMRMLRQLVQGLISYRFTPMVTEMVEKPAPAPTSPPVSSPPKEPAPASADQRSVETTRKPTSDVPSRVRKAVEPPASSLILPPEPAQTAAGLNNPSSWLPPHRPPVKISPPLPREEPEPVPAAPEDNGDRPSDGDALTQVFSAKAAPSTPPLPPPPRKPRILSPTLPSMTAIKREP